MGIDSKSKQQQASEESIPSYEASVGGSGPSVAAPSSEPPHSISDRVTVLPAGAPAPPGAVGPGPHLVAQVGGPARNAHPRPGRRFLAALFWALAIYFTLCLVAAAIVDFAESQHQGKHRHDPPGGPHKPGKVPEPLPPIPGPGHGGKHHKGDEWSKAEFRILPVLQQQLPGIQNLWGQH